MSFGLDLWRVRQVHWKEEPCVQGHTQRLQTTLVTGIDSQMISICCLWGQSRIASICFLWETWFIFHSSPLSN